jgi:Ca2+-binding RTX toxin-like protein
MTIRKKTANVKVGNSIRKLSRDGRQEWQRRRSDDDGAGFAWHHRPGSPAIDARLDTERPNGGPRGNTFLTNALLPGSPALDAGDPNGGCDGEDARGVPRTLGGRCDKGAYERVTCRGVLVNRVGTGAGDSSNRPNLRPTSLSDGYLGLGGGDAFRGEDGNDGLCGGKGPDELRGGAGTDRLNGGPGHDVCFGGPGKDSATGCEEKHSIP